VPVTASAASAPRADDLLEVRDLQTSFFTDQGVARAVDRVSFTLHAGEALGIVGESGCGKSVTALSIMRLIPDPPGRIVGGRVVFQGQDLLSLSPEDMRKIRGNQISMIFQEPMTSLNPVFRVGDQIAEVIQLHRKLGRKAALEQAAEMLRRVGIPAPETRIRDYPHQLSGGMRQRVMIAMALACDPRLIIADEPTTAVDVTIQAQILELMQQLKETSGASILLITHDLGVIAELVEQVIVMYAGRVVEQAGVIDLFDQPLHPYTQGLMGSIPSVAAQLGHAHLAAIPGVVPNLLALPAGCKFSDRCPSVFERCQVEPDLLRHGAERLVRCWLYAQEEP
jgi:peptide/nickel transport system ATP-binding protein